MNRPKKDWKWFLCIGIFVGCGLIHKMWPLFMDVAVAEGAVDWDRADQNLIRHAVLVIGLTIAYPVFRFGPLKDEFLESKTERVVLFLGWLAAVGVFLLRLKARL